MKCTKLNLILFDNQAFIDNEYSKITHKIGGEDHAFFNLSSNISVEFST
jgi:hypothetical protein